MTVAAARFVVGGRDAATALGRPYTVIYDGECRVCTRLAALVRRWDTRRAVDVVPWQAPGVMARFPWIPARAFAESLQMVAPDGRTWSGADAVEHILDVLPRGAAVAWIFRIPFARAVAGRAYRWFARNRHRLGCGRHCAVRLSTGSWSESRQESAPGRDAGNF